MNPISKLRNRHFFVLDLLFLPIAVYLSFALRLDTYRVGSPDLWAGLALFTVVAVIVLPLVFLRVGIYRRYWRYASLDEFLLLAGAVMVGTLVTSGAAWLLITIFNLSVVVPRAVPLIFVFVGLGVTALPRITVRWVSSYQRQGRMKPQKVCGDYGSRGYGGKVGAGVAI
jgi:FlaA1/EpsC-like NDP-sugar epimerase